MTPFYSRDGITIYLGDSREILPTLSPGSIVTDPPYPDQYEDEYNYFTPLFLNEFECHQLVFWSARAEFPLSYSAIHIWDKKMGAKRAEYERIFERHGQNGYRMFRHYFINSTVAASYTRDIFLGHKSQKPVSLMSDLIKKLVKVGPIVDPFMGSGSTLEAAYKHGYDSIGIELNERYAEMAVSRLERLPIRMPNKAIQPTAQARLFPQD